MRIPVPQLPEPIVVEGKQVGEVNNCYGYDQKRRRWLITDEFENILFEVSQSEAVYDGKVMWTLESAFWQAPLQPTDVGTLEDIEAMPEDNQDTMENAIVRWLEGQ